MIKKEYLKPAIEVIDDECESQLLAGSLQSVSTNLDDEEELEYDEGGGDQENAW